MRAAIYMRISTAMQTLECQRPEISWLVQQKGYTVVLNYEEQASAAKMRPEFARMLMDAAARKFDVLVVWALDRFGRNMAGNIADVIALDRLGIRVVSVREPWMDTTGPVRDLLVAIFSWCAQQERDRLIERTRAGIAVSKAKGVVWGRPSRGLIQESARPAVMRLWWKEGRPDGFTGLGRRLGGCSRTHARNLWLAFTEGTGIPQMNNPAHAVRLSLPAEPPYEPSPEPPGLDLSE
jgi:DNA invertase Pin-like site-specific DNA recombinase